MAFAAEIARLLDDPVERQRLGRAAQRRQREQFRFEQTISELESLYERLHSDATSDLPPYGSPSSTATSVRRHPGDN
jgi:hypothetical protein